MSWRLFLAVLAFLAISPEAAADSFNERFGDPLRAMVRAAAARELIPVNVALAVVEQESGFNPRALSPARAYGISQVLCGAAKQFGHKGTCNDLYDPETNLRFGMKILAAALERSGLTCEGLTLYNIGIYTKRPRCTKYGREVLQRLMRYDSLAGR